MPKHLERIAKDHTSHGNETPGGASFFPHGFGACAEIQVPITFPPPNVNQRTRTRQSLPPHSGWKLDAFTGTRTILAAHEMGLRKKKDLQIEAFSRVILTSDVYNKGKYSEVKITPYSGPLTLK